MNRAARALESAPQEVIWWDRLLIRLPGYSLFAWLGAYGLHQAGDITLGTAVLLFFTLAFPLLAGWQIFHILRSRQRLRAWRTRQQLAQGALGIPDLPEIQAKLAQIASTRAQRSEPMKPRFGGVAIFFLALGITGLAIALGIVLAELGVAQLSAFAIITLFLGAIRPLQLMGVANRAYRAVSSMPKQLAEIRDLVEQERFTTTSQRTTQAADSALDASLQIIDAALTHARARYFSAAVDCTQLLLALAETCWFAGSPARNRTEKLQRRVNAALAQLHIEERKTVRGTRSCEFGQ